MASSLLLHASLKAFIEFSAGAAVFIGYHASTSNPQGVRAHTVSSAHFTRLAINGTAVTEAEFNAAYAGDLTQLLVCRFLTGLGLGGAMPSFISLASEYVPKARRATVVSLLWAGFPLGGVIGGVLGSWIIPAYGWQSIFLVGGFLPILLSVILATVLPESVSFLVAAGKPTDRIGRTLRRTRTCVAGWAGSV